MGDKQVRALACELLPLVDQRGANATALEALGWRTFALVNERYADAWCESESDVALSRLIEDEEIKEHKFPQAYCSLPVRKAKAEFRREDLGVTYGSWGPDSYLTPARRAQLEDELTGQRAKFWAIRQHYSRLQQEARAAELDCVASGASGQLGVVET